MCLAFFVVAVFWPAAAAARTLGTTGATRSIVALPTGSAPLGPAGSCAGNLWVTGRVHYAEPGCAEEQLFSIKNEQLCCGSCGAPPVLPPATPPATGCTDRPARRARVELLIDGVISFVTASDAVGDFEFCLTNGNPSSSFDLQVVTLPCADATDDGDACGSLPSGVSQPWSVTVTDTASAPYLTVSSVASGVCTGSVRWDIFDRRSQHNGAQAIYDVLANDAFDVLQSEALWTNDKQLPVEFPAAATGFAAPPPGPSPGVVTIASGDEQDPDRILRAFSYFVLHQLYDQVFPAAATDCDDEDWGEHSPVSCAWIDGAAYFLQAAIQNDPQFVDTPAPGAAPIVQLDLEAAVPAASHKDDEGGVAATLWDLLDTPEDTVWDDVDRTLLEIWNALDEKPAEICAFYQELGLGDLSNPFFGHRTQCAYAAMGDSYSAGKGVRPYYTASDTPPNRCHRSQKAYASDVWAGLLVRGTSGLGFREEDFLACTNAVTDNVVANGEPPENGPNEPPQLGKEYHAAFDSPIVGDQTDLVTITIGGNDVHFADALTLCIGSVLPPGVVDCSARAAWKPIQNITLGEAVAGLITSIALPGGALEDTYTGIRAQAPNASIYVLGYPQLVVRHTYPLACNGLSFFDRRFIRESTTALNDEIENVAQRVGVHFVSVVDHFKGHGACAPLLARDWIRGIYVPDAGASFHPKPRGQKEYSKPLLRRIATQIEQGDPLLPNGLPANPTPTLIPTPAPALAAPPAGPVEPLPGIDHLDIVAEPLPPCDTRGFYEPGQQVRVTGSGFTANTTVYLSFEAAENEVEDDLGTDLADPSGDLDSLVTIPSGAPTSGLATLRAVGLRDDGSALLLVSDLIGLTPSTTSDGDGDTVPDVCDVCPEVMDIMQADGDGDGIGDVCDSCAADDENDSDFDGICDAADTCPFDAADDADGDGVCADADICPLDFDPNQEDADGDGTGDACPCGDDVVDPNEACDDGNREDLDGCSSLCEEEDVWTFAGSAEGGAIDFEVDGVALSVSTSAGQSAEEVAFSVALAIDAHLTLRAAGAATVWEGGNALGINRRVSNVVITDPGISHGTSIPSLAPLGRLIVALSIPLWGLAALALRRRRRRG